MKFLIILALFTLATSSFANCFLLEIEGVVETREDELVIVLEKDTPNERVLELPNNFSFNMKTLVGQTVQGNFVTKKLKLKSGDTILSTRSLSLVNNEERTTERDAPVTSRGSTNCR